MTKKELIDTYRKQTGANVKDANQQLNAMFDVLADSLHREGKIRIDSFGTFEVKNRPARTVRNPQTGQPLKVKASKAVGFKAASALRERMQQKVPKRAKTKAA